MKATRKSSSVDIISFSTMIIEFDISHWIAVTNDLSSIRPSAHHPAVFFTQSGIPSVCDSLCCILETTMIPSLIRYSIALTNSVSEMTSSAHHPAVFFTQSGTDSAFATGNIPMKNIPTKNK